MNELNAASIHERFIANRIQFAGIIEKLSQCKTATERGREKKRNQNLF